MNSLSKDTVVDQMVSQLAELRHTSKGRRAAYLALAQAILMDEPQEFFGRHDLEGQAALVGEPGRAA